jgi:hypothetical protein
MAYRFSNTLASLQVQARRNTTTTDEATNAFNSAQEAAENLANRGFVDRAVGSALSNRGTAAGALASRLGQRGPSFGSTTGAVRGSVQQRQNYGSMLQQMLEDDQDYNLLDASSRDVYLTASHGLTSQYPAILLTTPRAAKVVDVGSGLTTTPFIIDLNNEVKKTVESDVKAALDQNTALLQLTTTQYDQNVQIARQYSDLCLQTAISKDKLIRLLNIANVDTNQNSYFRSFNLIGERYDYLRSVSSITDYLKNINEDYNINVFEVGTNTQSIAQILKTVYFYFLFGELAFTENYSLNGPYAAAKEGIIDGYLSEFYVNQIRNLRKIVPEIVSINDANVRSVQLYDNGSPIFGFEPFKNADKITSLVRLIQRDLTIHGLRNEQFEITGSTTDVTALDILGNYTSLYTQIKDYERATSEDRDVVSIGYRNINEILESSDAVVGFRSETRASSSQRFRDALVTVDSGGIGYGKFDVVKGIDYLIYDDLSRSNSSLEFSNLLNSSEQYDLYARQINDLVFNTIVQNQSAIVDKIKDYFLSFIRGSAINTDEISSSGSAFRIACFVMATNDDKTMTRLFRLICALDKKINDDDLNQAEISAARLKLADDIFGKRSAETGDGNVTILGAQAESVIQSVNYSTVFSYMQDDDSSFQTFHNVVRETERVLIDDIGNFQRFFDARTSFGLTLTRDARAFVILNLFLSIFREMNITVDYSPTDQKMTVKYYPDQFKALKLSIENAELSPSDLDTTINQYLANSTDFVNSNRVQKFKDSVRYLQSTYFNSIVQKINQQNQVCLDLVNLLVNHAQQIKNQAQDFKTKVENVARLQRSNQLQSTESLLNAIQSEQAFLKRNIVDRYTNLLRGAAYLPTAIDHNVGQALNTKTAVATHPDLNDPISDIVTRQFLVAVGLPTGLMETLRYQNTVSTSEHLYSIDLVFKNLQVTQDEEDTRTLESFVTKGYTFSTRVFINEGAQQTGGADTRASELKNYSQIYGATKYKIIDDAGNYRDISITDLESILGDSKIVNNHLMSHYAKLLLKTTAGITLDEEVFDLIPQGRRYPDAAQDANYTTIVDRIAVNYPDTPEGQLNKERVLRDLSRSIQLAPDQHKTSMMVSKTFERIHVIPVDVSEVIEQLQISREDIAFLDVVAKVRLEASQPPVSFEAATTRRSYSNALQNALTTFVETDVRSQGIDSVGINAVVETSNRFGGRLGGNNR